MLAELQGIEAVGDVLGAYRGSIGALAEVRCLAGAVEATTDRLDILINNAGIGTAGPASDQRRLNYLAGFLLTLLLLPLVKNSAPARIVNVSSAGQQPNGPDCPTQEFIAD